MKIKIVTKIAVFTILLFIFVIGIASYFSFVIERNLLLDRTSEVQDSILKTFVQVGEDVWTSKDILVGMNYVKLIKQDNPTIVYAILTNENNRIVVHSDSQYLDKILDEEITRSSSNGKQVFEKYSPMFLGKKYIGTARLGFARDLIENEISQVLAQTRGRILKVYFAVLPIGIIGALLLSYTITKPIKKLAAGAELIGEGKLDTKININTGDELSWLGEKFNQMGDKLKELDEMKQDFVSNVTHELRSPLSAVESYINFMLRGGEKEFAKTGDKNLLTMKRELNRLSEFISKLLDISKIEAMELKLERQPIKVSAIFDEVGTLFKEELKENEIELKISGFENLPKVYADKEKIKQVFINLVDNAKKFTPHRGKISVYAKEQDNLVRICVSDTGVGIPKEYLGKMFNKFEQIKTMSKTKGTGLGLFIVKAIVEAHNGKIWVESPDPETNTGSRFCFVLPVLSEEVTTHA